MDNRLAVKSYVEDLFRYLENFETNPQQFATEAFLQTYSGIGAVFQALRQQRDKAVELDQFLLEKIKQAPLTSSDLRQTTVQVLVAFFEAEADIDGQSNRAYTYVRGLRAVKQDVPFIEKHLTPLLFRDGSMNNNYPLCMFFLGEMARYMNTFGKPLQTSISPEAFNALADPLKFLELARRRLQMGKELMQDRSSLEFHVHRIEGFAKLADRSPLFDYHLKQWRYVVKSGGFWTRVGAFLGGLGGKLTGVFSSSRYFRMSLSQRNPAYGFYGVVIILFLLLALYVPLKWSQYRQDKLEKMRTHLTELKGGG
ncbi:MAG: hypothetical protein OEV49_02360 [candidate division Zixibacteria bacterium]|nr:hypothetical protein [candidate division Zixibacteria bacterium]MDH3937638.1 hypothetical protein [candidate division Zixibacteria bacterium]MDH4034144.1 hypothetical protein [candidate division Zixibacteria bacterium]